MVSSMSTNNPSSLMELSDYIGVSCHLSPQLSCIVACISVLMILSVSYQFRLKLFSNHCSWEEPIVLVGPLQGSFMASFLLGWVVTTCSSIFAYPLDTIRRRMMMTSGTKAHYKSGLDAATQIVANEGIKGLFRGGG